MSQLLVGENMNQSDAQTTPNYVTCSCQYCSGKIEFDANQLDPTGIAERMSTAQTVPCPHCGLETILFVPPPNPSPVSNPVSPLVPHDKTVNAGNNVGKSKYSENYATTLQVIGWVLCCTCIGAIAGLPLVIIGVDMARKAQTEKAAARAAKENDARVIREAVEAVKRAEREAAYLKSPEYFAQCLAFLGLNEKTTPTTVDSFIGQDTVKTKTGQAYETAKQNNKRPPHILLIGLQGYGKSALGSLIARTYANSSGTTYKVASAKGLNKIGDLVGPLTNLEEGDVFFIDDIDQLDQAIAFSLRSAAVDFKLDVIFDEEPNARSVRLNLPHFTLIATATDKSELSPLLVAGFPVVVELGCYSPEEITGITRKLAGNLGLKIDDEAIQQISSSAGDSPSTVLFLLELVRVFAQARQVSEKITLDIVIEALKTLPATRQSEQGREAILSETKREVWRRDGGSCVQCGSQAKLEYDHIIPVSKGGSNTARNIQLLCEACNRAKSNSIQ